MEFSDSAHDEFRENLHEIGKTHMPFGRFGPNEFPPSGIPIMDLPLEYLQWFAERGYPNGRLGELMQIVAEIKDVGMDSVFEPLRKARGGRASVRKKKNS